MAFDGGGLRVIGACRGFALWHYASSDSLSDILTSGYFNDAFGLIRAGHHLHVSARIALDEDGHWLAARDHAVLAVTLARRDVVTVSPLGVALNGTDGSHA